MHVPRESNAVIDVSKDQSVISAFLPLLLTAYTGIL